MKKFLIVCGDSYCDPTFRSGGHPDLDVSWPKWPEMLAEEWGMDIINLSQAGQGNEFIYSRLQDTIMNIKDKSRIGMVIPAWSQVHRWDWQVSKGHQSWKHANSKFSWVSDRIQGQGDLIGWMRKSCRHFLALQILCERYDIPYMQFGMIHPYQNFLGGLKPTENQMVELGLTDDDGMEYPFGSKAGDEKKIHRVISEYSKVIDMEKFPGWPLDQKIGGYTLNYEVIGWNQIEELPWVISKIDQHPNAKGQVKLKDWIKLKVEIVYDGLG